MNATGRAWFLFQNKQTRFGLEKGAGDARDGKHLSLLVPSLDEVVASTRSSGLRFPNTDAPVTLMFESRKRELNLLYGESICTSSWARGPLLQREVHLRVHIVNGILMRK
jgi:hypothetical protein